MKKKPSKIHLSLEKLTIAKLSNASTIKGKGLLVAHHDDGVYENSKVVCSKTDIGGPDAPNTTRPTQKPLVFL